MDQSARSTLSRVMLSSTFRNLKEHREAVLDTMPSYDFLQVAMEYDAALPEEDLISASLKKVEEADAYVGIIGNLYGQRPVCPVRNPKKLSLTELEFRRAQELGKPTCMFLMGPSHQVPASESQSEYGTKTKLENFRKLATQGRIYAEFNSVEELRAKALLSFHKLREVLNQKSEVLKEAKIDAPPAVSDPVKKAPAFFAVPDYIPGHPFEGRIKELLLLDEWAKTEEAALICEAIGGMGKSMLTWRWAGVEAMKVRTDWAGRFWYSFYERGADMADFCAFALAYVTGRPLREFRGRKTAALTPELIAALKERPWLFVLDGVERVLVAYNRFDAAQAADEDVNRDPEKAGRDPQACMQPADEELLRQLSSVHPTKILITSRLMPRALLNRSGQPLPGVRHVDLQGLDPADAEQLMRRAGAEGDSQRMQRYIQQHFAGHPLVVGVVAGLVMRYRSKPGDFDRWADDPNGGAEIDLASMDVMQKRNHILKAAFADLTPEELVLMGRLGLISDAVDFETIEALNPYQPEPPEKVEEPKELENFRIAGLMHRLEQANQEERGEIQRNIEQLRAKDCEIYEKKNTAYQEYLWSLKKWRELPEVKSAPSRLQQSLDDLEKRGLLNWHRSGNLYDLHPVVRNYAINSLPESQMQQIGQKVVDHFTSRADTPYEAAEKMADIRNGLQATRALMQIGALEKSYSILRGGLRAALWYNLERYNDYLAVIRPWFPDGWTNPPLPLDSGMVSDITSEVAAILGYIGRVNEGMVIGEYSISTTIKKKNISNLGIELRNQCQILVDANKIAAAERVLLLEEELANLDSNQDHKTKAIQGKISYLLGIGRFKEAETALETFNTFPRPLDRGLYGRGDIEEVTCDLRLAQGKLNDELLLNAFQAAGESKNRGVIRRLHALRGTWLLQSGRFGEAEPALEEAIAMARESGLPTPEVEARLAMAQAKQGKLESARETAERIAELEGPPNVSLAELFLTLEDLARAREHALRGYREAWADGMPYVNWWDLQRCRAVLSAVGEPEPKLPPFDPSKTKPLPFEAELKKFIAELKAEKTKEEKARSNPDEA